MARNNDPRRTTDAKHSTAPDQHTSTASSGEHEHRLDPGEPPSVGVVTAVASVLDETPADLRPPLYDVVDPDALDRLFRNSAERGETTVTFSAWGCLVSVGGNGLVSARRLDPTADRDR